MSGKLDFEDFKKLWSDLAICKVSNRYSAVLWAFLPHFCWFLLDKLCKLSYQLELLVQFFSEVIYLVMHFVYPLPVTVFQNVSSLLWFLFLCDPLCSLFVQSSSLRGLLSLVVPLWSSFLCGRGPYRVTRGRGRT